MQRIEGQDLDRIKPYFDAAAQAAKDARCHRAKCGAVIVAEDGEIIGRGYNAPPSDDESQRTCNEIFDRSKKPKYDLTCCDHAEWRADIDALRNHPEKVGGSILYFMRIDEQGDFTDAGDPYCTTCSRFTLLAGVAKFALWNDNGADIYTLPEYNKASYSYHR